MRLRVLCHPLAPSLCITKVTRSGKMDVTLSLLSATNQKIPLVYMMLPIRLA